MLPQQQYQRDAITMKMIKLAKHIRCHSLFAVPAFCVAVLITKDSSLQFPDSLAMSLHYFDNKILIHLICS